MKRLFSFLMCLCMLLCFCSCDADVLDELSQVTTIAESPVEDFTYEMRDGEITITGYIGTDRKIRIPSKINERPVTTIGENAFLKYDMTYIYIPKTVTTIGEGAFYKCVCLEDVFFTNGLEIICENAFAGCEKLQECKLPESLTLLESSAFDDCTSLKSVSFPKNLKEISSYAFSGCTALVKIIFAEGLERINHNAFSDCTSLVEVTLPESLQFLENDSFANCDHLRKLTIPKNTRLEIEFTETHVNSYGIDAMLYSISSPVGYQSWYGGNMIGVYPGHPTNPTPFSTILLVSKDSFAHTQLMSVEKYGCLKFEVH